MNLVQQAEQIKLIPDAVLGPMQQNPTVFPPFLVLAEMQRREAMRNSSRATGDPVQQKTVAEEMREKFNPAPQMQQPTQNPQQQMAQPMPQPGMPSMRLAGGGTIRAAGGLAALDEYVGQNEVTPTGGLDSLMGMPVVSAGARQAMQFSPIAPTPLGTYINDPATTSEQLAQRYPTSTLAQTKAETDALRGPSKLQQLFDLLATQEKDARGKKPKIGEILMNLGLAMAASKRPDFAGAVGEGGLAALHGYSKQRDANLERADSLMKQRMGLAEAMQRSDEQGIANALGVHAQKQHNRNTDQQTTEASKRARLNQIEETERNDRTQDRYERNQDARDKSAAARDDARFAATATERAEDRAHRETLADKQIAAQIALHAKTGGGSNPASAFLLKSAHESLMTNRANLSQLYRALESASPEDKTAYQTQIKALEKENKLWKSTLRAGLKELGAGIDLSGFDEEKESDKKLTPAQLKAILDAKIAAAKPAAPSGPSLQDKAVSGLKSLTSILVPNVDPAVNAVKNAVSGFRWHQPDRTGKP